MQVTFIYIGKTNQNFVKEGFEMYKKRIVHYTKFNEICIEDVKNPKNLTSTKLKDLEGEKLLKKISKTDFVVLLDENGKTFTSVKFANWIEQKMIQSTKNLVFIVGGAFGFSDAVYQRANSKLRLSDMTFSHQIIRAIFAEQLYRAFSIIKGESYHNV
ncbi:MAG: 23S rRNA (pseudouridine(1915)-N(3))-methyltransferase RlmH [Chitinophagales bacterium]